MGRRWFKRWAQVAGMVVLTGLHLRGAHPIRRADVILYVDGLGFPPAPIDSAAREILKQMYAQLGISVEWREGSPKTGVESGGAVVIQIRFTTAIPTSASAYALAFARPYADNKAIVVMYERIAAVADGKATLQRCLLAHVLAHEIGHVLEGTTVHSETGVMRARWRGSDYSDMVRRPLDFTPEDAAMIARGLASWKSRPAGKQP